MIEELSKIATGLELGYDIFEYSPEPDKKFKVMSIKESSIQFFDLGATAVARVMIQLRPEDGARLKAMREPMATNALMAIGKAASHGPYYHTFEYDEEGRISIINIDRRAVFRAEDISSIQLFIDMMQELMERVMHVTATLTEIFGLPADATNLHPETNTDGMYN